MPPDPPRATPARGTLLRRLRMLRNLEWFNIPFLFLVLANVWSDPTWRMWWQRLIAYVLVAVLLAVGGWYWHLKVRQIDDRRPLADHLSSLDRIGRAAPYVLAAATAALAASWVGEIGDGRDRLWASGFLLLAWAEYVNYFRVQLIHDTRSDLRRLRRTQRLRRSWLAADLAEWRRKSER